MNDYFDQYFNSQLGQTWTWIAIFSGAFLLTFCVKTALKFISKKWQSYSTHTPVRIDDILAVEIGQTRGWAIFIWVLYGLSSFAPADPSFAKLLRALVVICTTLQVGIWGSYALKVWNKSYFERRVKNDASSASAVKLLTTGVNCIFFAALLLICLSNLGIDIGALVAGMGIGGIAIALAAQNILGDLFASLSIVLDKPFVVGDYIVVGQDQGAVENIGIKTTRVRSLTGEELIFANKDLLESRVKNFKRMWKRRVALKISVAYDTPVAQLKQVPKWFEQKIKSYPVLTFERSHLAEYGTSALTFETIFWVNNSDVQQYMDLQQEILLSMIETFRDQNIGFALPTQVFKGDYPWNQVGEEEAPQAQAQGAVQRSAESPRV